MPENLRSAPLIAAEGRTLEHVRIARYTGESRRFPASALFGYLIRSPTAHCPVGVLAALPREKALTQRYCFI
jgi:hypothetical protein